MGEFISPHEALDYARKNGVDYAMLDVVMPGMSGLELGEALRRINPRIILAYISCDRDYCADAMDMRADDYVFKPIGCDLIGGAIEKAILLKPRLKRPERLKVRAFGKLEVWAGEERLHFSSTKARELLALLIDRKGNEVSMDEVIELLWSDRPVDERTKRLYRKAIGEIRKMLSPHGMAAALETGWKCCRLNPQYVQCDYYDYLQGKRDFPGSPGEYLKEYSWAEMTAAKLYFGERDRLGRRAGGQGTRQSGAAPQSRPQV